jgi:hypothetical protein
MVFTEAEKKDEKLFTWDNFFHSRRFIQTEWWSEFNQFLSSFIQDVPFRWIVVYMIHFSSILGDSSGI